MTDFSHLKTWLNNGHRPVILECVVSRSGLSLSVYDREKLLYRINGCGFDRLGCALAEFLEALYQPELTLAMMQGPVGYGCHFKTHSKGKSLAEEPASVSLDGYCGIESMSEIARAVGLTVQVHETRSSTLLIIQKEKV